MFDNKKLSELERINQELKQEISDLKAEMKASQQAELCLTAFKILLALSKDLNLEQSFAVALQAQARQQLNAYGQLGSSLGGLWTSKNG